MSRVQAWHSSTAGEENTSEMLETRVGVTCGPLVMLAATDGSCSSKFEGPQSHPPLVQVNEQAQRKGSCPMFLPFALCCSQPGSRCNWCGSNEVRTGHNTLNLSSHKSTRDWVGRNPAQWSPPQRLLLHITRFSRSGGAPEISSQKWEQFPWH